MDRATIAFDGRDKIFAKPMGDKPNQPQATRVLIAEDAPAVATLVRTLVCSSGHEVVGCAKDGAEAVQMCESLRPDVVLMDVEMPTLDGIAATLLLMERCPTPVVIVSAHEDSKITSAASEAGAGAYLIKPPSAGDLQRAITIALARFADIVSLRKLNADLVERTAQLQRTNKELAQALSRVEQLSGLLPICASCKNVRDDEGYWHGVETYISTHSKVEFSHGLCPTCFGKLYPDLADDIDDEKPAP